LEENELYEEYGDYEELGQEESEGFGVFKLRELATSRVQTWADLIKQLFSPDDGVIVKKEFGIANYKKRKLNEQNHELSMVRELLNFSAALYAFNLHGLAGFYAEKARIIAVTSLGDEGFAPKLLVTSVGIQKFEAKSDKKGWRDKL